MMNKYYEMGKQAFENGQMRVPVKDKAFMDTVERYEKVNDEKFNTLTENCKYWGMGWDDAQTEVLKKQFPEMYN